MSADFLRRIAALEKRVNDHDIQLAELRNQPQTTEVSRQLDDNLAEFQARARTQIAVRERSARKSPKADA